MGISVRAGNWLKDAGYDVVHIGDNGLNTLPDIKIIDKANYYGRR